MDIFDRFGFDKREHELAGMDATIVKVSAID
jgi:hypothetical protein